MNNNVKPPESALPFGDTAVPPRSRKMRGAAEPVTWVAQAREQESTMTRLSRQMSEMFGRAADWLRPDPPGDQPVPTAMAQALTARHPLTDWLGYRDFDDEKKLMYITTADSFRVGFAMGFAPLIAAGTDVEPQLEALLSNCPPETVLQFGVLSGGQVEGIVNGWAKARVEQNPHPMLQEIALRRAEYFSAAAQTGGSLLLTETQFQPRNLFYYVIVTLVYSGDHMDAENLERFMKSVTALRSTLEGGMQGASLPCWQLGRVDVEFLLTELMAPQFTPEQRREMVTGHGDFPHCLQPKESRVRVMNGGLIGFSNASDPDPAHEVCAAVLTMDAPPMDGWLPNTSRLMGHPQSRDDRIGSPFWLHTTIHVPHPDKTKDRLTLKVGSLNKQLMSDSGWYRSMMGHLYSQKEDLDGLIQAGRAGHQPVRVWAGCVLYSTRDRVQREVEYVANLWRKAGFRCSPERFIALPVFLASMPFLYDPAIDQPARGLQRATTVSAFNAATLLHVQGDWAGSDPRRGGPLLVSRRGQLATIDLFDTSSNYNFCVIAQSGSGKSFLSVELAQDFLSRNGVVRIFDVGRSYKRFATSMQGVVLEFTPDNPVSLNPFSGINTHADLNELMPVLKSLIRQMAFPLTTDEEMEAKYNWEYQAIEQAITTAWEIHRGATGLRQVYEWMAVQEEPRYQDLAFQLHSYAVGRYQAWFNGPRQVELNNDLIIVELEDLEVDPDLQGVVLTLMIHQITKDMYLTDPERKRPKLLLVDEGWRLLGEKQSGGFIAKSFRTVRKYRGAAGVITQSYADFATSPAARAALENSAWQFVLKQKGESIDFAAEQRWLAKDEQLLAMLKTVSSDTRSGFSEVYIRGDDGQGGVYRFITDRHTYWLYTTHPKDLARLAEVQASGLSLIEAVDYLARSDYATLKPNFIPAPGSLREKAIADYKAAMERAA